MSRTIEGRSIPWATYHLDPDASAHDLLNDATTMLRYSHGLTEMMREAMHDAEAVDFLCASYALGAIASLTQMGLDCMTQAHTRVTVGGASAAV